MVGNSIENYRIDEVLGHGGMGVVYKAMDTSLDRVVALKVMNPGFAADEEFLWRFKSEAKVLGRLLHPNIVNVYAFRHIEPHLFIVMEYVDGGTLSSLINARGTIAIPEALPILKQCLTALEIAHNGNIIHRDIKPQNILLTTGGQVKISDFGLAKIQENTSTNMTRVGVTGGTIYYMPPEQSVALNQVDHRGDIYSLGMTMYQMLAGRMPFDDGSSTLTILRAIDEQRIPPPNKFNPQLPAGLADIIMRAIKKDRSERFQSAHEMRVALDQFEAQQEAEGPAPMGTRIYSPPERTQIYSAPGRPPTPAPVKALEKKAAPQQPLVLPSLLKKPAILIGILLTLVIVAAVLFSLNSGVEGASGEQAGIPNDPVSPQIQLPSETGNENLTASGNVTLPETIPEQESTPPTTINNDPVTSENKPEIQPEQSQTKAAPPPASRSPGRTPQEVVEPPQAQSQGSVRIVVRPYGDILINGASRATATNAAFETTLDAGTHLIGATHPALGKWEKRVQISAGAIHEVLFNFNTEINVTIISDPVNAEIFIDGVSTARFTPSQLKLRPGNHTITVQKEGFTSRDGVKNILLENELSSPIDFKLEKNQ